jgi:hypothetical protein
MSSSRGSLRSSTGTFRSKAICAGVLFVLQSGQAYKYTDPIVVQAENKERHQKLPAKTRARKHPPSKNRENKERQIVQRAPHRKCERERQKSQVQRQPRTVAGRKTRNSLDSLVSSSARARLVL